MRKTMLLLWCAMLAASCAHAEISVVPRPASVQVCKGEFVFSGDTAVTTDPALDAAARAVAQLIPPSSPKREKPVDEGIHIERVKAPDLGAEGYILDISPGKIRIRAQEAAGAFYAAQTLRQLAAQSRAIPCGTIRDMPRFKWRGLMIDVARHFQPKEEIFKIIDAMALFKMNTLHMHLVDDQGWRLEIDAFPQLTKIGSKREASGKFDLCMSPAGDAHQGFYTKDDMHAIIAYAAERFITVVPEIELPGHATAAIASIKGLSCLNKRFKVSNCWGVHPDIFCAGEEKVFEFLEKVLAEVAELFPGPYIHIGGDEAPKDRWKACPKCQKRIKDEGLKDEHELQSWFISRIEKHVNALGKQIIGWDEILEGGLPPRAAVMSWRGMQGGTDAAMQGHAVVMSPTSHCYLDYRQSAQPEPNAVGPVTTLEKTYSFEPVPEGLPAEAAKHIMGVQGNLWTEHIATPEHLQYMAFPRALAIAEAGWSPVTARDWAGFSRRLPAALALLKSMGVNYREPREGELAK